MATAPRGGFQESHAWESCGARGLGVRKTSQNSWGSGCPSSVPQTHRDTHACMHSMHAAQCTHTNMQIHRLHSSYVSTCTCTCGVYTRTHMAHGHITRARDTHGTCTWIHTWHVHMDKHGTRTWTHSNVHMDIQHVDTWHVHVDTHRHGTYMWTRHMHVDTQHMHMGTLSHWVCSNQERSSWKAKHSPGLQPLSGQSQGAASVEPSHPSTTESSCLHSPWVVTGVSLVSWPQVSGLGSCLGSPWTESHMLPRAEPHMQVTSNI